jgi:hypothetical protein
MKNAILIAILMVLVAMLAFGPEFSCRGGGKGSAPPPDSGPVNRGLPMVEMKIGNRTFTLEVAKTEEARQIGLMNRDSMAANQGMIFVFGQEQPLSFWMKNTRIALEILYLDAGGRVVSIHQMTPLSLSAVLSGAPAKYAIELNKATVQKAGVKVGDVLVIPKEVLGAGGE